MVIAGFYTEISSKACGYYEKCGLCELLMDTTT